MVARKQHLETSHDLVEENEARVRDILRIVGADEDTAEDAADNEEEGGPKARGLDHRSARGTWSAWDS